MSLTNLSDIYNTGASGSGSVGMDQVHDKYKVEYKTIGVMDLINKYVTINAEPENGAKVKVEIVDGPRLEYGVDFVVNTAAQRVDWNGLTLDGLLLSGEKFRVTYFEV